MSKNTLIIIVSIIVIILSVALVLLLVLIPQVKPTGLNSTGEEDKINKSEYTYIPTKENVETSLIQEYVVTDRKITVGIKNKNYVPGNYNPFSPPADVKEVVVNPYSEKSTDK